jgi:hypothetical protein
MQWLSEGSLMHRITFGTPEGELYPDYNSEKEKEMFRTIIAATSP